MSFLSKLFAPAERSVLGVDIGSSSLKVVQLKRERGAAVLETYGELSLGPYAGAEVGQATDLPADKISETLRDLLRETKVTTNRCGVSIPFARSLLTMVELPYRESAAEQKTVIELEARKYVPVPINEVRLDWFIVPGSKLQSHNEKPTTVQVLLVAVHNDELTLLQETAQGANLDVGFYEIEIFSTIRAVVDEPVKPVMVLDIGAASTKAYVVERGAIAFSHAISTGSQNVTRALAVGNNLTLSRAEALKKEIGVAQDTYDAPETVFSRVFSEARRVLEQFETMHKKTIDSIVLTGGGGVTKDLGTYAKSFFSIGVRVADPFVKTEAPAFMRPVLERIGPEFAVAVGLALRQLNEQ